MTIEEIFNEYYTTLDNLDKSMADSNVAEKGIDKFLSQQLIYLDCSRIIQGMRMMQTIGYPYRRELMIFFYVLDKAIWTDGKQDEHHKEWSDKLIALHEANLKYEEINPPVWYGGKKAKEAVEALYPGVVSSDGFKSFPSGHTFSAGTIYALICLPDVFEKFNNKIINF